MNGGSVLFTMTGIKTDVIDFVAKVKEWVDKNLVEQNITFGKEVEYDNPITIPQLVVVNPNEGAREELRSLIIQYQMSTDLMTREKGKKLSVAIECNASSLVETYVALKQQTSGPTLTSEGEAILLNNAQTIIDVKTNLSMQLQQQPLQSMYLQQQQPLQSLFVQQETLQPMYVQQQQPLQSMYVQQETLQPMYVQEQPLQPMKVQQEEEGQIIYT